MSMTEDRDLKNLNVRVSIELRKKAKLRALEEGITLEALINRALENELQRLSNAKEQGKSNESIC